MNRILLLVIMMISTFAVAQQKGKDYSHILKSNNLFEINAFLRDAHPDDPRRSVLRPKVIEMMKQYIKDAQPTDPKLKKVQEMLAILRSGKSSTKISFGEMNAAIRDKQIKKLKEQLEGKQVAYVPTKTTSTTGTTNTKASTDRSISTNTSAAPRTSTSTATIASNYKSMSASEEEEFNLLMNEAPELKKQKTVKILNQLFDNDPTTKETAIFIENKSDCNIIVRIEGAGNTKYRLAVPSKGDNTMVIQKGEYLFTSNVCGAQYASQKTVQKALMVTLNNPK